MKDNKVLNYIKDIIKNHPADWLGLTTHRLDIYNEKLAKTQFLDQLETLYSKNNASTGALAVLPTAYDYIRLGHPLSSVLEWGIAHLHGLDAENVISFSSKTIPVLAVLRKNLLEDRDTQINYTGELPDILNSELLKEVYGYHFQLQKVNAPSDVASFNGSTIFITEHDEINTVDLNSNIDFSISLHGDLGSILVINSSLDKTFISDIQHVRRRETIAMTPSNSLVALKSLVDQKPIVLEKNNLSADKTSVLNSIKEITGTELTPLVASSGLSIQYAIMMGLIHDAQVNHPGKAIKFIVPPNCYGGTNDQARRVAACLNNVEVVDLPVDGDNDMVQSVDIVLNQIAAQDAVPYIIAEIPTNPRVEVPDLVALKEALSKERKTPDGTIAIDPVFILDQTFCPNVHFLGDGKMLSTVRTISYASGSKFPSGGKCTAGYCVGNNKTSALIDKINLHLTLCDNEATALQYEILAAQLPSMNQRINDAYKNTREFVTFVQEILPNAKINFVSEELAEQGFTPSVFSLDLPTQGNNDEERERYKRELNLKLINLMITEIPQESKFCVSYGQLKGCYWTIPATSTQGTTKEGDKDYIVRASLSPDLDLDLHKKVFKDFVDSI
ncbi:cystathionine beta-synthase [Nonlabens ulvanivorans]|uniref:cystathionine beta-synthase n=1 Tax=Nonlabens ulvanivorans TaxID=906888 RepID=UPI0037C699FE